MRPIRLALVVGALALTLTAAPPSSAEPRPNPCYDYTDLEAGHAAPDRQGVFNHLDARGYARWRMACVYGWGTAQYDCLDRLWTAESGWYHHADGPNGPAGNTWGIPQAYPGTKMATFGADWRDNPRTQVKWGLEYIAGRYRTPTGTGCTAGY